MQRKYAVLVRQMQRIFLNHNKKCNEKQARRNRNYTEPVLYPLRIYTINQIFFVNMYYLQPILLCKSNIAKANLCHCFNVVSDGSPSRIRRVLLISLGMTTRPRSSILRTIPVAFISWSPLLFFFSKSLQSYFVNGVWFYSEQKWFEGLEIYWNRRKISYNKSGKFYKRYQ